MHGIAILAALALHAGSEAAIANAGRTAPLAERTLRVGPVFISGADDMSSSAILNALGFHFNDEVPYRRLREAERRLAGLGLFVVDPVTGVRPRIDLDPDAAPTGLTALNVTVVKKP
jgi:hypothetical protein